MKKKALSLVLGLFLAVAGLTLAGCSGNTSDAVPTIRHIDAAAAGVETNGITVRGTVESVESRNVYTTLGFLVERVYVRVGDEVTAGQTLAALDTGDLELMIAQQRLELETARTMAEIIPPQRRAELASMRRIAELAPQQQNSELAVIRQTNENAILQSRRMYEEAAANLTNDTNMHIVQAEGFLSAAESAVTAAELNLSAARRNYEVALADYRAGINPHLLGAESALNSARIHLATTESDHERFQRLYEAGGLSRNDLRQSETAVIHARNAYNDAATNIETAAEAERRGIELHRSAVEQAELALYAATSAHRDAQTMLQTTRLATQQELDMLRSNLETVQVAANIEPMEIAMNLANLEITSGLEAMEHAINLELAQLNATVEALELALQLLERQLENSMITSPINGTVTAVIATEGAVGMGLMFIVEDTTNLRVMTSFREYEITKIDTGMAVVIHADAMGAVGHEGVISRISPSANINSPIVEFEVEVAILSENTGLRIGMNTRILVDLE